MEINAKTKINDLLKTYPELEEKIIQAAPAFKNLKNPVLRNTVGRLATVEKVVQIGGIDLTQFVNMLRRTVGQPELAPAPAAILEIPVPVRQGEPEWLAGDVQFTVDGRELLAEGEVPVNHINALLPKLKDGSLIVLITDFLPAPMIDALMKQKRQVYHKTDPQDESKHLTYIK
ncbi:MAG: DUF1858 domain-containing protein [Anaerolineaceae bacterium]|nr:DUF1858 domain-containing protein [Anaerolineaceae bacterium]